MEAIENLEPVMDADFVGALRCPECGCLDYMEDLPNEIRFAIWKEAKRIRGIRHVHPARRIDHRGVRFVPAPGGVAVVEERASVRAGTRLAMSAK
ncbi:MAG: hypothetical protein ACRDSJ_06470 [Rubrobacteraceae bacterium]